MSKLDDILNYLDSGFDSDIDWSERSGSRVFMQYTDGTSLIVTVQEAGGSGS